jgi:hypothetical protein
VASEGDLKFCEDPRPALANPNTWAPRARVRIERGQPGYLETSDRWMPLCARTLALIRPSHAKRQCSECPSSCFESKPLCRERYASDVFSRLLIRDLLADGDKETKGA